MSTATQLQRIGVIVHPQRALEGALGTLRDWARRSGGEVVQLRVDGQDREVAPPGDVAACDLIAALGGDGTTLAALSRAAAAGKPVLGVACGSLGALTSVTAAELEGALEAVAAGAWHGQALPGVAAATDAGDELVAVNDLAVLRGGASQVVVGVLVDGELYARFAGDGLVVATPLGSSAYTLAAGGPMLAPGSRSLALTPLAAHGGCIPPLVADRDSRVTVEIDPGHAGSRIELDGRVVDLRPRSLEIAWRDAVATLVAFDDAESTFAGLRRRRIIIDSPRIAVREGRL